MELDHEFPFVGVEVWEESIDEREEDLIRPGEIRRPGAPTIVPAVPTIGDTGEVELTRDAFRPDLRGAGSTPASGRCSCGDTGWGQETGLLIRERG